MKGVKSSEVKEQGKDEAISVALQVRVLSRLSERLTCLDSSTGNLWRK